MTFQYIIHHLDKPHSWFIVLTTLHTELNTKFFCWYIYYIYVLKVI